jgi:CheY-like chemotaxis protein
MSRILIFDDDTDILELCALVLQTRGYETEVETSCRNVIARIKEAKPDVILMDNWIPDIGGIRATQLIKNTKETRSIPVIFFSASNDIENIFKEANADYYLKKPFDIAVLERVVINAIESRQIDYSPAGAI